MAIKTLFLSIFDPRSSIVDSFFDCDIPGVSMRTSEESVSQKHSLLTHAHTLRKTIEGNLDLFPSLTFNTIKTKLIIHAFHSSRYLQSK